ncbi:CBS domain-containing protein [Desulfovulcanus sp.]
MIKAKDIMSTDPIVVYPETEIAEAVKILLSEHVNGLPVVDKEMNIKGILCQSDLVAMQKKFPLPSMFTILDSFFPLSSLSHFEKELEKMAAVKVKEAMTPDPQTITSETPLEEIAQIMAEKKFHTLPVVEKGKLIGVVGKEDVLRTLFSPKK